MSIIQLQRRLVEVGRLRMGEKRVAQSGKSFPAKLKNWRITSPDRSRLEAIGQSYGGKTRPWEGQHEIYTEVDSLDIAVIPGQAVSQNMEDWGQQPDRGDNKPRPVMCLRRCNGQFDAISDQACPCRAGAGEDGKLKCKPVTHLSVMLRKVPGIGTWRCTSRGDNAAIELATTAEMLEQLTAAGQLVPARLRLDQRSSVTPDGVTVHYVVPVIDIDVSLDDIFGNPGALALGQTMQQIAAAPAAIEAPGGNGNGDGPRFTPVDRETVPVAPARSIADQFGDFEGEASEAERARKARANAAQPIPATGARPTPRSGGDGGTEFAPGGQPPARPAPVPSSSPVQLVDSDGAQTVARWCGEAGIGDGLRSAFLWAFSNGAYKSATEVPVDDLASMRQTLQAVYKGDVVLDVDPDGTNGGPRLVDPNAPGDSPGIGTGPTPPAPPSVFWKQKLATVRGVANAKLIRRARELAGDLGIPQPTDLDGITDPTLTGQLLAWLDEQSASA